MRVAFYTLGCKVNQFETAALKEQFSGAGYTIVEPEESADIYVINSCTVTAEGDKKSRQALRRFRRQSPGAVLALTGCFPQAFPVEASRIAEADIVCGNSRRSGLEGLVREFLSTGQRVEAVAPHPETARFEAMPAGAFHHRTRPFVKIQDGCRQFCSYCIIPAARGSLRSMPLGQLATELSSLAAQGHREVVLTGINLPCYGVDLGLGLLDAVELACTIDGLDRVRLGSLEPELITGKDLERMASLDKLCPQFHLSLQSGCDATLARMNRPYDTGQYRNIVEALRRVFPGCAVTTDIMAGFPGETEAEFAETLDFVREMGFAKAHVFAYSRRPGTKAADMPCQVNPETKAVRSRLLAAVAQETRTAFLAAQVGTVQPVLFEIVPAGSPQTGHTPNFTPVTVSQPQPLTGRIYPVEIISSGPDGCEGRLAHTI